MKKVFVDLHVLQSLPPNCLNRDDTGSPKTAIYGGVRRARVSSQAWKRAMRSMFKDYFDASELGIRTLQIYDLIAQEIIKIKPDLLPDDAMKMVQDILPKAGIKASQKKGAENKAEALFFMGVQQAQNLAALALGQIDGKDSEKEIIKLLNSNMAIDIALFGRMVASNPLLNCDASAQVAHAISTHRVENEFDFFTAVDDLAPEDNAGAGMLGTVEYNSATLYRYATVAVHELFSRLASDSMALEQAIREFTRAFICSMPTGKQNTFAANTVPDAVLATIRTDRPLNLVGAFETPVYAEGLVIASANKLEEYAQSVYADFCPMPTKAYVVGQHLGALGERMPLEILLANIGKEAASMVTL
jgi:CRISPR system Cascade subunit CasC